MNTRTDILMRIFGFLIFLIAVIGIGTLLNASVLAIRKREWILAVIPLAMITVFLFCIGLALTK